ncbi:MAG: winged helix-turn-helix domain-containing protein [Blautia producta]
MEAVLKRAYGKPQEGEEVDCGSFLLNVSKGVVQSQGKEIELTKNENRILYCLGKNRGKVVSRDDLINDLWDSELFVDDNTLTVNMTRLRGKLEELGISQVIHTKRGQGYWLE